MVVCPQCGRTADFGRMRLVQDTCGHKKCRECLLSEESGCLSCHQPDSGVATAPVYAELQPVGPNAESFFSQHTEEAQCELLCSGPEVDPIECQNTAECDALSVTGTETIPVKTSVEFSELSGCVNEISKDGQENTERDGVKGVECESGEESEGEDEDSEKRRHSVILKEHIVITPGDPPVYHCTICKKSYKNRGAARYHNYCGSSDAEKPHRCEVCGQGFITKSHYTYHMKSHTGVLPFSCDVCQKGFKQSSKLKRHKQSHDGDRPFKCELCSRSFCAKHVLNDHMMSHGGLRPFSCSVCDKRLSSKSCLRKHKLLHTVPTHKCDDCGKTFSVKWNLEMHRKTHTRERKYKCKQCNRPFKLASDLRRHAIVHQEDGTWDCKVCNLIFGRKDNLVRHMKNIHPENQQNGMSRVVSQNKIISPEMKQNGDANASSRNNNATVVKTINSKNTRLELCAATPPPAPQAVSVIRSWAVPVIQKTDRRNISETGGNSNEKYLPTISKTTYTAEHDDSGLSKKVHTFIAATPFEAEVASNSNVAGLHYNIRPENSHWQGNPSEVTDLPASESHFRVSESQVVPNDRVIDRTTPQSKSPPLLEHVMQRESVVRHSDARVILHFGSSTHGSVPVMHLEDVSNMRTRVQLPLQSHELVSNKIASHVDEEGLGKSGSVCRPRVIVVKENCDMEEHDK